MASSESFDPYDAPDDLRCPITHALFRDPVFNSLGNTYERDAIRTAFDKQHWPKRDPLTNVELPDERLVPDQRARRAVTSWLEASVGGATRLPLPPLVFEREPRATASRALAQLRWSDHAPTYAAAAAAETVRIIPAHREAEEEEEVETPWS